MDFNWVFIVTIVLIVAFAIKGWREGILGLVLSLISWIVVIALIYSFSPKVENFLLTETPAYEKVYTSVEKQLNKKAEEEGEASVNEWYASATQGLPEKESRELSENLQQFNGAGDNVDLSGLVNGNGISNDTAGGINSLLAVDNGKATVMSIIADKITMFIMHCLAVVITFLIAELLVFIVGLVIKAVGRMPVVKPANLLLGVIGGAFEGVFVVWILFYIVACISTTALGQDIIAQIYQNPLLITLYENNLIMSIL
ncbi:MAG: CvpA family protein [Lachnospiraceae bacterium]|nr:CvpA family protein [Lachnospiraceae bacterium]